MQKNELTGLCRIAAALPAKKTDRPGSLRGALWLHALQAALLLPLRDMPLNVAVPRRSRRSAHAARLKNQSIVIHNPYLLDDGITVCRGGSPLRALVVVPPTTDRFSEKSNPETNTLPEHPPPEHPSPEHPPPRVEPQPGSSSVTFSRPGSRAAAPRNGAQRFGGPGGLPAGAGSAEKVSAPHS
eukprot:gene12903-biopygen11206